MKISATGFGKAASDYGRFRAGFPNSLFDRLATFGIGLAGHVVVDLGTGTGTLARGFAARDCEVVGVDADPRMLATALELAARDGVQARWVEARAEATGLPNAMADTVTAGQCWHWFDRTRAGAEARRLLKPGGSLVIAHFDWLPLAGNVVAATERLIEQHNPDWRLGGGIGIHGQWLPGLAAAGFVQLETFPYDVDVPYSHEGWCGRIRASAGVTAMTDDVARAFEGELTGLLERQWPDRELAVPHRVFAVIGRSLA